MAGEKLVFLFQSLGRIPGCSFFDKYANEVLTKSLTMRSHKERAEELQQRGKDVGRATKDVAGVGGKGKGNKGKKGSQSGGGAPQGRGSRTGQRERGGAPNSSGNEWGNTSGSQGLRKPPPSNTDRLRNPESDQHPKQDRLRRKNYDL